MQKKRFRQSDFMALQLMEIENFRAILARQSEENVSFQDAVLLWIAQGHAEDFRSEYARKRALTEPAQA